MKRDSKYVRPGQGMQAAQLNAIISDLDRMSVTGRGASNLGSGVSLGDTTGREEFFHTPFEGSYAPESATLTVGLQRGFTGASDEAYSYPWIADRIKWVTPTGTQIIKALTTLDSVTIAADKTYVYYEITNSGGAGTIAATLKKDTTWPPTSDPSDVYTHLELVGIARFDGSYIVGWHQILQGEIVVFSAGTANIDFEAYKNGTDMTIRAGHVTAGDQEAAMSSEDYPLATDVWAYVEITYTLATGVYAITAGLQDSATEPDEYDLTSGVETYKIAIASIASGEFTQRRIGRIFWASKSAPSTDELVAADSSDPTAGYLDAKVQNSIVNDATAHKIHLSGDAASPGANQVYGTDSGGTKGWKADPAGAPTAGDAIAVSGTTVNVDPSKPAAVTTLAGTDVLIVETSAGVRKITAANLIIALLELVSSYNASNVQSIVNDTGTLAWLDMIEQQDALKEITDHGNSKTLETDATGEALWV